MDAKNIKFKRFYGSKERWESAINSKEWKDAIVFGQIKDPESDKLEYKIYAGSVDISVGRDSSTIHYVYDTGLGGPSTAHIDISTCNPEDYYQAYEIIPAHGDYYIKEEYVVFKNKITNEFVKSDDQNAIPDKTVEPRRTAYIFNSSLNNGDGAWQALDGNVNATNVYFKDGVSRTAAIGKWKEENEEKVEGLGLNLKELLEYYLLAKKFKIKFYDASFYGTDDGKFDPSLYNTQSVTENKKPVAPTNPGTKTTPKYTYNFIKWVPDLVDAVEDTSYNASYGKTINKYKITWNWFTDGANSGTPQKQEPSVEYDVIPTPPSIPLTYKTNASVYTLKDSSWSPEIVKVKGATSYNASYNVSTRQYNIRWRDGNGHPYPANSLEISDVSINWNATPVAPTGTPPVPAATAQYTYVANNSWTPAIHPVNGDQIYNASYNWIINKYTITWNNWDGSQLEVDSQVPYGSTVSYNGNTPKKDMTEASTYTFTGWNPATQSVKGDATYTAKFQDYARKYKIEWYKENSYIDNTSVAWHTMPTHSIPSKSDSADGHYRYEFAAWTPTLSVVTRDTSYNATYNAITKTYTVQWMDGDGKTVLETDTNVAWGTTTSYNRSSLPTKQQSTTCSYIFTSWNPDAAKTPITGNTKCIPQFTQKALPNLYTNGVIMVKGQSVDTDAKWSNNGNYSLDINNATKLPPVSQNNTKYHIGFGDSGNKERAVIFVPTNISIAITFGATTNDDMEIIDWSDPVEYFPNKTERKYWKLASEDTTWSGPTQVEKDNVIYDIYENVTANSTTIYSNSYEFNASIK